MADQQDNILNENPIGQENGKVGPIGGGAGDADGGNGGDDGNGGGGQSGGGRVGHGRVEKQRFKVWPQKLLKKAF